MVQELGYQPIPRKLSAEENTITVLSTYHTRGKTAAQTQLTQLQAQDPLAVDRLLLAMHSVVALMEFELTKVIDLIALLVTADND